MRQHTKTAMRREMIEAVRTTPACPDGNGGPCPYCVAYVTAEIAEKYADAEAAVAVAAVTPEPRA